MTEELFMGMKFKVRKRRYSLPAPHRALLIMGAIQYEQDEYMTAPKHTSGIARNLLNALAAHMAAQRG